MLNVSYLRDYRLSVLEKCYKSVVAQVDGPLRNIIIKQMKIF